MRNFLILSFAVAWPALAGAAPKRQLVIPSGDVDALHAAVADPANANSRLLLEAGTYILLPDGRPHGGTLLLQPGMELVGQNVYADDDGDGVWDASFEGNPVIAGATVLDATGLELHGDPGVPPAADCVGNVFAEEGGVVVAYRTRNLIEGLTILAPPGFRAIGEPHPSLLPPSGFDVEVRDCLLDSYSFGAPGVTFGNFSCDMRDAHSRGLLERSIVRGWLFGAATVNGLTTQPGEVPRGPSLEVTFRRNQFLVGALGIHSRNTAGTDGGELTVISDGNHYVGWFAAIEATGASNLGLATPGVGNRLRLTSRGDSFVANQIGIWALGAWRQGGAATGFRDNRLDVDVAGARFEGGEAIRAWPLFFAPREGEHANRVALRVAGADLGGAPVRVIDPYPEDDNRVEIAGNDTSFALRNGAAPTYSTALVPPRRFDLQGAANALRFSPVDDGFAVTAFHAELATDLGAAVEWSHAPELPFPGDDDTAALALPFAFPFLGEEHDTVWINCDGNLTFGGGDAASDARDVARLVSWPLPRIAPLLTDFIPRPGQVRARLGTDGAVITWDRVPTYLGWIDENSVQVVLHPDGTIDFVYGGVDTSEAVVGVARGSDLGPMVAADLDVAAGDVVAPTVYEEFYLEIGP